MPSVSTWAESYSGQTQERVEITVNFSVSQNTSANTSTITITSITCYYNYDYYSGKSFYIDGIIKINGSQAFYSNYKTPQATVGAGSYDTYPISGGTYTPVTISHNSSGAATATFTFAAVNTGNVSGFAGINGNYTNYQFFVRDDEYCTRTYTLPTIQQKYTITYNANGGSGTAPSSHSVIPGNSITLRNNTFTRAGYVFIGWGTSTTSTSVLQPGTSYKPDKTRTLYAIWKQGGIKIYTSDGWKNAIPYIYTGSTSGWKKAIPYVYKNSTDGWKSSVL